MECAYVTAASRAIQCFDDLLRCQTPTLESPSLEAILVTVTSEQCTSRRDLEPTSTVERVGEANRSVRAVYC